MRHRSAALPILIILAALLGFGLMVAADKTANQETADVQ